jgi:uncharacterized protein YuzE
MNARYNYDSDADAIAIGIGAKKPDHSVELTEHIIVDLTGDLKLAGIEILSASEEISKIFNRAVGKGEMKQLLCEIRQEPKNEYLIQFKSPQKNEKANLLIPLYRSPIIT